MKRKIEITYEWWSEEGHNPEDYADGLTEAAKEHIAAQINEGYVEGKMFDYAGPEGGDEEFEFKGYWKFLSKDGNDLVDVDSPKSEETILEAIRVVTTWHAHNSANTYRVPPSQILDDLVQALIRKVESG